MRIDGPQIREGSSLTNAVLPSGTVFPVSPDLGELFYMSSGNTGLFIYNGEMWYEPGGDTFIANESTRQAVVIVGRSLDDSSRINFYGADGVTAQGTIYSTPTYLSLLDSTLTKGLVLEVLTGNVGIGTSTPSSKLEIAGVSPYITIDDSISNSGRGVLFQQGGVNHAGIVHYGTAHTLYPNELAIKNYVNGALTLHTNSTERVRITAAGNVGIGTTTPASDAQLTLSGPLDVSLMFQRTNTALYESSITVTGGEMTFKGGADSATVAGLTEFMRISATGNVGIGTAAPPDFGPNYKTIEVVGTTGGGVFRSTSNTVVCEMYAEHTNSAGFLTTVGAYPLVFAPNQQERMRIDSAGNIGIGTAAPSDFGAGYKTIEIKGTSGGGIFRSSSDTVICDVYADGGAGLGILRTVGAYPLVFTTNGAQRMRIDSAGNVGIGTTPNRQFEVAVPPTPAATVVNETADFAGAMAISHSGTSNNGDRLPLLFRVGGKGAEVISAAIVGEREASGWNTALSFWTNNVTSGPEGVDAIQEKMRIDSAGNVGIGTNAPSAKLDVQVTDGRIQYHSAVNVTGTRLVTTNVANNSYVPLEINTASFHVTDGTHTEKFRIDANGNIGLGVVPTSTWNSTARALQINGYNALVGYTNPVLRLVNNAVLKSTGDSYGVSGVGAGYYQQYNGIHSWMCAPSGTAGDPITFIQTMTLNANGYLGIGTAAPSAKLEVNESTNASLDALLVARGGNSLSAELRFLTKNSSGVNTGGAIGFDADFGLVLTGSATSVDGAQNVVIDSAGVMTVNNATDATSKDTGALVLTSGGLGVELSIFAGGNVTAYSDRRIKTNIEKIPDAINKVQQLNGYTFDRTDVDIPRQTGVIAQEVLAVLPEAVSGSEEHGYGVAYGNIVGLLIEAIKEQSAVITELKHRVETLESNK